MSRALLLWVAALAAVFFGIVDAPANASPIVAGDVIVEITGTAGPDSQSLSGVVSETPDGTTGFAIINVADADQPAGPVFDLIDINALGNVGGGNAFGPSASLAFTLVNTSSFDAEITATINVPLGEAFGPATLLAGSVGGSVTDNDSNGASVSTIGADPIFRALIDGVEVQTLVDALTDSVGDTGTVDIPTANIPTGVFGPEADASLSIEINVVVSAGDQLGITSAFGATPDIDPNVIPEPASAMLVAAGIFMVGGRRRVRGVVA